MGLACLNAQSFIMVNSLSRAATREDFPPSLLGSFTETLRILYLISLSRSRFLLLRRYALSVSKNHDSLGADILELLLSSFPLSFPHLVHLYIPHHDN